MGGRDPCSERDRSDTPSAYHRPGYPLAGCSPAEPASVSPGRGEIPAEARASKISQGLLVWSAGKGVAKECSIFVQNLGSTSHSQQACCRISSASCSYPHPSTRKIPLEYARHPREAVAAATHRSGRFVPFAFETYRKYPRFTRTSSNGRLNCPLRFANGTSE